MPKVTYIEASGKEHVVDVPDGWSAMQGAVENGVRGIDGDCGGNAACATCHVYVDPAWLAKTGPAREGQEKTMLDLAEGTQDNSRLACQITLTDALDGLVLRMPERQF
jgi:2Fe-2S ferredoxin